jgi:outer membrane protein OmpA-like peptidoglycan-associated protein
MRVIKIFALCVCFFTGEHIIAQQVPSKNNPNVNNLAKKEPLKQKAKPSKKEYALSNLSLTAGAGISSYIGDLIANTTAFKQSSYSFNAGLSYALIPHLNARFDVGYHNVQGYDSKEGGAHPSRNLSFRSNILEVSLAGEYTLLDMNKHKFSPYIFVGIGAFHFNPRAYYGPGGTTKLRDLGTEGQGLAGYPDFYSTTAVEFPLGFGIKYKISKRITLQGEFNYRPTTTDYLDDVSGFYPDKALLDARNPQTSKFTYRGGGPYPINPLLKRGDETKKDGYFTTQIKIAYNLKSNKKKSDKEKDLPLLPTKFNAIDSDGDGVTDEFDKCPDVKGSTENNGCPAVEKIENADRDSDGIADSLDKCPDVKGSIENYGCPVVKKIIVDRDEDGVPDAQDKCPDVKGSTENEGCPFPLIEGAEILKSSKDSMTFYVFFDLDRSNLLPDAFKSLSSIVRIMQADKSLFIIIGGHTDTVGTSISNIKLSQERAFVTRDYLLSYYIAADRITTNFYGETMPIDNIQQWRNRRVEITLYKK